MIYHVFNKSIDEYKIFNNSLEFSRMIGVICYYRFEKPPIKYSKFKDQLHLRGGGGEKLVEIIAYCLMPTHFHLVLKELKEKGISIFINNILNSYTRYFNIKHNRKGPLWEGRSKKILVEHNEQLLHLTRYIHLNPVTAYLVGDPEEWPASSYQEYVSMSRGNDSDRICKYEDILDINPASYRKFVEDMISYEVELTKIKDLLFE